ncbi:hypothetical protein, partial [Flavobacterium sp.]|uniref:hypothetical protein n=1 Tax=Flavobacterium sp. TaxID=239 RepID=UPI0025C0E1F9
VRSRFWFSRKAFLLLLRPGKSSPAEGDELQHPAAKLPQTQNERSSFISGIVRKTFRFHLK